MKGLTNIYVEKLGKSLFKRKKFLGVFPCDLIKFKSKTFSLICNLSKHNEVGTHFVALFCRNKKLTFFDPLGDKLENKFIIKFLDKLNLTKLSDLKLKIQNDESSFCGFYCIAFLIACYENKLLQFFSKMKRCKNNEEICKINDINCIKFICKYIKRIK